MPRLPELVGDAKYRLPPCPTCGGRPIERMDAYFAWQIICMKCRTQTHKWHRPLDAELEWEQVICRKEVD